MDQIDSSRGHSLPYLCRRDGKPGPTSLRFTTALTGYDCKILILCELQAAAIVHRAIDPISLGVSLTGHLCLDFCDNAVVRGDLEAAPKYFPRGPLLLYTPPEVFAHCRCSPDGLVYLASDMAPAAVSDTYDVWCMGICILEMFWPGPQPLLHDDALSTLSSEEFRARLANPDLDRLTVMRYLNNRHPTLLDLVHKVCTFLVRYSRWLLIQHFRL